MTSVFELDKQKIRRSFSAASDSYDRLAILQRKAGYKLLKKFAGSNVSGRVLDVGCGTGFLTSELLKGNTIECMLALDVAFSMLQVARCNVADSKTKYLCADAELLPLQAQSIDWVFSNLALQWCGDLRAVFAGLHKCIRPGGKLVFATFGPQTLKELKYAWSLVDDYTHVNQFYSVNRLSSFLDQAGFKQITIQSYCYVSHYNGVIGLMRELKGIGAHNVTNGRNRAITGKGDFQKMVTAYEALSGNALLPATFEIIYVTARVNALKKKENWHRVSRATQRIQSS